MLKKIVVDFIIRIEGYLRIEVIVDDDNVIIDVFFFFMFFRGLEMIIKGRDL